jgi:hypothetical protein
MCLRNYADWVDITHTILIDDAVIVLEDEQFGVVQSSISTFPTAATHVTRAPGRRSRNASR